MSHEIKFNFKKGEKISGTRLTPLRIIRKPCGPSKKILLMYECQCDCGKLHCATPSALGTGRVKSCGCYKNEATRKRTITHGLSHHPEYAIAHAAFLRCTDPNNKYYSRYGGRGIKFEFANSAELTRWLLENMPRPKEGKWLLDRKNNNGNYVRGNLRWADPKTSGRNQRNTRTVEINGATRSIVEVAEEHGIENFTLRHRIDSGIPKELWLHKGKITKGILREFEFNSK